MGKKTRSEFDVAVGKALVAYRNCADLTQTEAAKRLGTTQASLSRYENGERVPSPGTVYSMLATYNVTPNSFFATVEQKAKARNVLKPNKEE